MFKSSGVEAWKRRTLYLKRVKINLNFKEEKIFFFFFLHNHAKDNARNFLHCVCRCLRSQAKWMANNVRTNPWYFTFWDVIGYDAVQPTKRAIITVFTSIVFQIQCFVTANLECDFRVAGSECVSPALLRVEECLVYARTQPDYRWTPQQLLILLPSNSFATVSLADLYHHEGEENNPIRSIQKQNGIWSPTW